MERHETPYPCKIWVKLYHYCSTRIALTLNNSPRLICHQNKENNAQGICFFEIFSWDSLPNDSLVWFYGTSTLEGDLMPNALYTYALVGWGSLIYRLLLPTLSVLVMTLNNLRFQWFLEVWGMQSTPSLSSIPGMVAFDKSPIYGSNRTKLRTYAKLNCLKNNCFDI